MLCENHFTSTLLRIWQTGLVSVGLFTSGFWTVPHQNARVGYFRKNEKILHMANEHTERKGLAQASA